MRDCRLCGRPLAGDNPRDICFECWREEYHKLEEQKVEAERQRDDLLADLDTAKFALLRISQSNTSGWTNDPSEVASFAIETATDALTAIARARSGSGDGVESEDVA